MYVLRYTPEVSHIPSNHFSVSWTKKPVAQGCSLANPHALWIMRVPAKSCHWCIFQFSKTCQERALGVEEKTRGFWKVEPKNNTLQPKEKDWIYLELDEELGLIRLLYLRLQNVANTLGCFGTSPRPFISLPENWSWHERRNLQQAKQTSQMEINKKSSRLEKNVKFPNLMYLKCSYSNFRGALEHVIFFHLSTTFLALGVENFGFVSSNNLWVYPNRQSYNKKIRKKRESPSLQNRLNQAHVEIAPFAVGFKLCRIGFPGVIGKTKQK